MPAIDPARLKRQTAELGAHFADPPAFLRHLTDLLEYYADRTRRPGQSGTPPPLIPAYNVPKPVIPQVLQDIMPAVKASPAQALNLVLSLWEQERWECRALAIGIFSRTPVSSPKAVLEQVNAWADEGLEDQLLQLLLTTGIRQLRQKHPKSVLRQARSWLAEPQPELNVRGLILLAGLVEKPDFVDPPEIFRILKRQLIKPSIELRPYIDEVLAGLIVNAPQETAFFLDQCLQDARSPDTAVIVRRVIARFPAQLQPALRAALGKSRSAG